jgi:acyl-CoA hydrolase
MEVGIKMIGENIRTQASRHVNSCLFTMVAVDDDRKPVPVPPLRPSSPEERRRHSAANVRKESANRAGEALRVDPQTGVLGFARRDAAGIPDEPHR